MGSPTGEALLWRDVYLATHKGKFFLQLAGGRSAEKFHSAKGVFSSVEFLHQVNTSCHVEMSVWGHFRCGISLFFLFLFLPLDKNTVRPLCTMWIPQGRGRPRGRAPKVSQGNIQQKRSLCQLASRLRRLRASRQQPFVLHTHPKGAGSRPLGLCMRLELFIH